MRDDDELRAVREPAQDAEEAVDVQIVERRLDLVEDVERARLGEEDREQERERGQRLLATREQAQALGGLAGGRDLDLDAEQLLAAGLLPPGGPGGLRLPLPRRGGPCAPRGFPPSGAPASTSTPPPWGGGPSAPRGGGVQMPPSPGRGPWSSRTSRSRPRPPGNSCPTSSSKLRAAAANVSSKALLMRWSV